VMQELFDSLCMPFPSDSIEWRVGSTNSEKTKGLPVCYLNARTVMDRLDSVCGPENWQCNYLPAPSLMICNIGLRIPGGEWIWKADGAGATDFEGEKGMLSDALKRAAVRWGVGRYLYEIDAKWVPIEQHGKSYSIPAIEIKRLNEFYEEYCDRFGWGAGRAGFNAYKLLDRAVDQFVRSPADAQEFKDRNIGMLPQLPVSMRKRIMEKLDRVGAAA
jgi:hypothetical protein